MKLFKIAKAILAQDGDQYFRLPDTDWDGLINRDELYIFLKEHIKLLPALSAAAAQDLPGTELLPPVGSQEIWAAGVTYFRSREARMDESKSAGGGDFYDRVYAADRPELFFKANPSRAVGSGQRVNIRKDSTWDVPEPELTLFINSQARIQGYTIGNDMSSRSIEGENPLYLPQAKTHDRCAGLGPCLYIPAAPMPAESMIRMKILRAGQTIFEDSIALSQMKRAHGELVRYLFRECSFPNGCYLMTGTGIVPPNSFTLKKEDEIRITIEPIGTLVNIVA